MAMTRKDYELIAEVIRVIPTGVNGVTITLQKASIAALFAAALTEDNPRFDRQKFIDAATGNREDNPWKDRYRGKQDGMTEYADPYVNPSA